VPTRFAVVWTLANGFAFACVRVGQDYFYTPLQKLSNGVAAAISALAFAVILAAAQSLALRSSGLSGVSKAWFRWTLAANLLTGWAHAFGWLAGEAASEPGPSHTGAEASTFPWSTVMSCLQGVPTALGVGLAQGLCLSRHWSRPLWARWTLLNLVGSLGAWAATSACRNLDPVGWMAGTSLAPTLIPWFLDAVAEAGLAGVVLGWITAGPLERLAAGNSGWIFPSPPRRPLGATLLCLYTLLGLLVFESPGNAVLLWDLLRGGAPGFTHYALCGLAVLASGVGALGPWKTALLWGGLTGLWAAVIATSGANVEQSLSNLFPFALTSAGLLLSSWGVEVHAKRLRVTGPPHLEAASSGAARR
jgi:hypothetical protein